MTPETNVTRQTDRHRDTETDRQTKLLHNDPTNTAGMRRNDEQVHTMIQII